RAGTDRGRVRVRARDRPAGRPVPGEPRVLHRERVRGDRTVRLRTGGSRAALRAAAMRTPWIVGVTGASGTPYAAAVLCGLFDAGEAVDLVVSRAARLTLLDESGIAFRDTHWRDDLAKWLDREPGDVAYWPAGDLAAGPSSGSYPARGMLVVPASTAACAG